MRAASLDAASRNSLSRRIIARVGRACGVVVRTLHLSAAF
jgi:hypothetical protein